mmetsp:Transcript_39364/g.70626  ORF Transcript_39364/g.70626 Transcript_39364/m.70626 type:complete len:203 (+) Transcript_39364:672-1280(+)
MQHFHYAILSVPFLDRAIGTATVQEAVEHRQAPDRRELPFQRRHTLPNRIPLLDRAVCAGAVDVAIVGDEGRDGVSVAAEGVEALAVLVPNFDSTVITSTVQMVTHDQHAPHRFFMPYQHAHLPILEGPLSDVCIAAAHVKQPIPDNHAPDTELLNHRQAQLVLRVPLHQRPCQVRGVHVLWGPHKAGNRGLACFGEVLGLK